MNGSNNKLMRETWKQIEGGMFDFQEFYQKIASQMPDGAVMIEVGVADGKSAIFLAEAMGNQGKSFQLWLVDNLEYGDSAQFDRIMLNLAKSGLQDNFKVEITDSLNASLQFKDNFADFIFIDSGHHYELTKAEIRLWHHKVKEGGYLAGHDYFGEHVMKAVDEVVPVEILETYDTDSHWGIWAYRKNGRL